MREETLEILGAIFIFLLFISGVIGLIMLADSLARYLGLGPIERIWIAVGILLLMFKG